MRLAISGSEASSASSAAASGKPQHIEAVLPYVMAYSGTLDADASRKVLMAVPVLIPGADPLVLQEGLVAIRIVRRVVVRYDQAQLKRLIHEIGRWAG